MWLLLTPPYLAAFAPPLTSAIATNAARSSSPTNKAYKNWPEIFNHDVGITSVILDRVLHHAETVVIEGKSFRMKDQIEP
jgi:DNA replication protein DnaC